MENEKYTPQEQRFLDTRDEVLIKFELLMEEGSEYPLSSLPINFNQGPIQEVVEGKAADNTRFQNMMQLYFFAPELDKMQIGRLHGITREAARLDIQNEYKRLEDAWEDNAIGSIPNMKKPMPPEYTSKTRNGVSYRIKKSYEDLVSQDLPEEVVMEKLHEVFTHKQINASFRKFGIETQKRLESPNSQLVEKLADIETPEEEVRSLLKKVTSSVLGSYRDHFFSPIDLAATYNLHVHSKNTREFVELMDSKGIPFASVPYQLKKGDEVIYRYRYASPIRFLEAAQELVISNPDFEPFWFRAA